MNSCHLIIISKMMIMQVNERIFIEMLGTSGVPLCLY